MSLLSKIGNFLSENILGIGQLGLGAASQINNQRLMNQQNDFNASQAALNRQFQSHEALLARQYQEDFYNTYQSPSAMVRQYKDAGLNPALMAEGYSPSTVSTSSPSGSSASATNTPYVDPSSIMSSVYQMEMQKLQIDNMKMDTLMKEQSAFNQYKQGLKAGADANLSKKQIHLLSEQINNLREDTLNKQQQRSLLVFQEILNRQLYNANKQDASLKEFQINVNNWKNEVHEKFGFYPSDSTVDSVINATANIVGNFLDFSLLDILGLGKKNKRKSAKLANDLNSKD